MPDGTTVVFTDKEQTIIDCLARPDRHGGAEALLRSLSATEFVDAERLAEYPMAASYCSYKEATESARSERLRIGATQAQAASALGIAGTRISELERCILFDESLLHRYRDWLDMISSKERWKTPELGLDSK